MLSIVHSDSFGQTAPTTADIADATRLVDILADGERRLYNAFAKFRSLASVLPRGSVPIDVIQRYNAARAAHIAAAAPWMAARAKTPRDELPDPNARPTPPPELTVTSRGLHGLTDANGVVPIADVRVRWGPTGEEKVMTLDDAALDLLTKQNELGVAWVVWVAIVFLVAIVGAVIIVRAVSADRAEVEAQRAAVAMANAKARSIEKEMSTLEAIVARCVGTSTDPAVGQKCLSLAQAAVAGVLEAQAKVEAEVAKAIKNAAEGKKQGGWPLGIFETVGLAVVIGAAAVGGYALYRRRKAQKGRLPEHEEEHVAALKPAAMTAGFARRRRAWAG